MNRSSWKCLRRDWLVGIAMTACLVWILPSILKSWGDREFGHVLNDRTLSFDRWQAGQYFRFRVIQPTALAISLLVIPGVLVVRTRTWMKIHASVLPAVPLYWRHGAAAYFAWIGLLWALNVLIRLTVFHPESPASVVPIALLFVLWSLWAYVHPRSKNFDSSSFDS
jgi:hypothetical protein